MRSKFRRWAHLEEQLGPRRVRILLNSKNTGKVKKFIDNLPSLPPVSFVVSEHFKEDISDTTEVKISYIGDNFRKWTKGMVEDISGSIQVPVFHHDLKEDSLDAEILEDLGGQEKSVTTLSGIFELLKLQRNREDGVLLTNGYANIFYVSLGGCLRAVFVLWFDDGWRVIALSVDVQRRWSAGHRVLSRNSAL